MNNEVRSVWEDCTAVRKVKKKRRLTWGDIQPRDRFKERIPRIRMFVFDPDREIVVTENKYGDGRDQYSFPILEFIGMERTEGHITTTSKSLINAIGIQVSHENFLTRSHVLVRRGEGIETRYTLRGFDSGFGAREEFSRQHNKMNEVEQ